MPPNSLVNNIGSGHRGIRSLPKPSRAGRAVAQPQEFDNSVGEAAETCPLLDKETIIMIDYVGVSILVATKTILAPPLHFPVENVCNCSYPLHGK